MYLVLIMSTDYKSNFLTNLFFILKVSIHQYKGIDNKTNKHPSYLIQCCMNDKAPDDLTPFFLRKKGE
jgi:hypothetical protein